MYDEITINDELDRDNLDWLSHISTRTGISVSGDMTITDDFARLVISTIKNQDKEITRLNNIINRLEKTLLEWHEYWEDDDDYTFEYKEVYDYLQELKENK